MAKRNKTTKSFPMWPIGKKIIGQFSKYKIKISLNKPSAFYVKYAKMLSFSLVAEALTRLIYHRSSGENSSFQFSSLQDYMMQENHVTSVNVQPLILKVVVRPIHRHVWHSPRTQNRKPAWLPGSRFS